MNKNTANTPKEKYMTLFYFYGFVIILCDWFDHFHS